LPVHCVVDYGKEKARRAAPHVAAFARQARQAGLEAGRLANFGLKTSVAKVGALVREVNLRMNSLPAKLNRKRSLAAVTVFVLFGAVVSGWELSAKHHMKGTTAEASAAIQAAPQMAVKNAMQTTVADANPAITTNEVDLGQSSDTASAAEISSSTSHEAPPAHTASRGPAGNGSTVHEKPLQPKLSMSAARTASENKLPGSSPANAAFGVRPPVVQLEPSEAAVPATLVQPAASSHSEPTEKLAGTVADPADYFLEVGSFKDAIWADQAVDQLSHLGYHAVAIHKAHLWIQSYHVEVGPYKTTTEMEAAQKMLASQNFKSHQVK
jgi:cell division protein FtsN